MAATWPHPSASLRPASAPVSPGTSLAAAATVVYNLLQGAGLHRFCLPYLHRLAAIHETKSHSWLSNKEEKSPAQYLLDNGLGSHYNRIYIRRTYLQLLGEWAMPEWISQELFATISGWDILVWAGAYGVWRYLTADPDVTTCDAETRRLQVVQANTRTRQVRSEVADVNRWEHRAMLLEKQRESVAHRHRQRRSVRRAA